MDDLTPDPYRDLYLCRIWTKKNGDKVFVDDMSTDHLKNTIAICKRAADVSIFKCDRQKWIAWHNMLCHKYNSRFIKGENK